MKIKSHVDIEKINAIKCNSQFNYKDVVEDNFPIDKHPEDGALFNEEVEEGMIKNEAIQKLRQSGQFNTFPKKPSALLFVSVTFVPFI